VGACASAPVFHIVDRDAPFLQVSLLAASAAVARFHLQGRTPAALQLVFLELPLRQLLQAVHCPIAWRLADGAPAGAMAQVWRAAGCEVWIRIESALDRGPR